MFLYWLAPFLWVAAVLAGDTSQEALVLTDLSLASPDLLLHISNSDLSIIDDNPIRDYYTLLVVTSTDEQHECVICHSLVEVVRKVARSWFADYTDHHYLYFAYVDIKDRSNADIFRFLEVLVIPHVWLIPPTTVSRAQEIQALLEDGVAVPVEPFQVLTQPYLPFQLPVALFDDQVFELADFLSQHTLKSIQIRQEDQVFKFVTAFGVTFAAILFLKKKGPLVLGKVFSKRRIYTAVVLLATVCFVCGYSFTVMEKVPFVARNDKGGIIVVSGGVSWQFGIEIIVVGATYLALGATLIILVHLGSYKVTENSVLGEKGKAALVVASAVVLYLLYSLLTTLYLCKDHDYPFPFTKVF